MILLLLGLSSISGAGASPLERREGAAPAAPMAVEFIDATRSRRIPVALYGATSGVPRRLAVLSPGYGGRNTDYGFLADYLVRRGYVVAAIQHDLAGDPPVPSGDNLAVRRRSAWEAGVSNIRFVALELRGRGIAKKGPLLLVGHSHGGDISMLFAATFPREVSAVFSLDNRRMALPRTTRPRICSARSSDFPADPNVLPGAGEQARHHMVITKLAGQRHDDMWDGADETQKAAMLEVLGRCLAER